MQTTTRDAEEKRLRKNANQRRKYAQLSPAKKEALLQKSRERYVQNKIKNAKDEGRQGIQSATMLAPSNAEISFNSSYEIGSCSVGVPITNCEYIGIETETHATDTPEHNLHTTTSRKRARTKVNRGPNKSSQDILKDIADRPSLLPSTPPCRYCGAKRFHHEPNGFCCSAGEVALISNSIPNELYDLYTSKSRDSDDFRTYVRTYNNTFAFTSFGVKYDKDLCQRNKGIYTFKIQGWHAGIKRVDKQQEQLCPDQFLVLPDGMKSANEIINKEEKVLAAAKKNQHGVSCREYYCYKLQIRPGDKSIILRAGRLLQQYVVDIQQGGSLLWRQCGEYTAST